MLTFFTMRRARETIETYLTDWSPDLRDCVRVVDYESLGRAGRLEPGTYVFCDQERWTRWQHYLAVRLWKQLAARGLAFVLLNDPRRILSRYRLLRTLFENGSNVFNVYRPHELLWRRPRYPVFLHSSGGHEGALSVLLSRKAALLFPFVKRMLRHPRREVVIEEFCETADERGNYGKFGTFHLDGQILFRHFHYGKAWSLKDTEILDEEVLRKNRCYLEKSPHRKELAAIFALAGVDFGRIDYSLCGERVQVWEINTNPYIISPREDCLPGEAEQAEFFSRQMRAELLRLSARHAAGDAMAYRLPGQF